MAEQFRMRIRDVFTLRDGTVVLAGTVMEGPSFIHAGMCQLSVEGRSLGNIQLEGERMNGGTHPEIRSVSMSHPLPFKIEELKNQEAIFSYKEAA